MTVAQPTVQEVDRLHEQDGKPLAAHYPGQYVAISHRGETIVGETVLEVPQKATESFGPGSVSYKIGPRVVGNFASLYRRPSFSSIPRRRARPCGRRSIRAWKDHPRL